ncbi:septal ring lytic transglycosylase RlpA family protein [Marinobacter sp. SS21]|uniref:septal ring lytic transglycosylase RlpA family protein n=1 Tax=Marinobacter sp. SS21 TaxID=2979460 RepID=UPI00232ED2FF|nr:septal ring lytic transglycosylase RlpA family protein [Marinobacter sp. SS21]MDC0664038.1 septal ring lytic transglycosylase RlpA family protein [Marinobacter sp. SS21]
MAVVSGCASSPSSSSRYALSQDRAPSGDFDASGLADAVPRYEPRRAAGNKSPYTVWGKQYWVLDSAAGYVQQGTASWYGEKFHGHRTSNGEVFDMYAMSAAHKSLPIPCYARVTNLENGRSVIVRVNDRGPFYGDRLIDLSYAAAIKLGYQGQGTARVEVAAITVTPDGALTVAGESMPEVGSVAGGGTGPGADGAMALFLQLGSFSHQAPAQLMAEQAEAVVASAVRVREVETAAGRFHRVQVGPFQNDGEAQRTRRELEARGFEESILLTDTR